MKRADKMRMIVWLMLAAAFYIAASQFKDPGQAQLSTGLWKAGHVTGGAFLGYWIDRQAYGRLEDWMSDGRKLSRAIVMAAAIVGLAFGL